MAVPLFLVELAARETKEGEHGEATLSGLRFLRVQTCVHQHLPPSRLISCRQVVKMGREEGRKGEIAKKCVASGSLPHKRLMFSN